MGRCNRVSVLPLGKRDLSSDFKQGLGCLPRSLDRLARDDPFKVAR